MPKLTMTTDNGEVVEVWTRVELLEWETAEAGKRDPNAATLHSLIVTELTQSYRKALALEEGAA